MSVVDVFFFFFFFFFSTHKNDNLQVGSHAFAFLGARWRSGRASDSES